MVPKPITPRLIRAEAAGRRVRPAVLQEVKEGNAALASATPVAFKKSRRFMRCFMGYGHQREPLGAVRRAVFLIGQHESFVERLYAACSEVGPRSPSEASEQFRRRWSSTSHRVCIRAFSNKP